MALQTNTSELSTDTLAEQPETPPTSGLSLERKLAGISTAVLLLGGTAWALTSQAETPEKPVSFPTDSPALTPTDSVAVVPGLNVAIQPKTDIAVTNGKLNVHDAPIAEDVKEAMSFDQAFETARQEVGAGGVFAWHNKVYNTFTKDEWSDLSLQQRQEFLTSVGYEPVAQTLHAYTGQTPPVQPEPVTIEGNINGQRVIGLDFDHDGVIDNLVMQGADGYTYHVVDASGNEGLDTVYQFDPMTQQTTMTRKLDKPYVLSNDSLQQDIEASMASEVVESVMATEPTNKQEEPVGEMGSDEENGGAGSDYKSGYVNDAEMEEFNNAEVEEHND